MNVRPSACRTAGRAAPDLGRRSMLRNCRESAMYLAVGLTTGSAAFVAISFFGASFGLTDEASRLQRQPSLTAEEALVVDDAVRVQTYQNTALSVAIFGGVAGGALGGVSGLRRRTATDAVGGFFTGTALGAFFGMAGGLLELWLAYRLWPMDFERTYKTMAAHAVAFTVTGVGIGLAAGFASRRILPCLGTVSAAALIAGLAYPLLAAAAFPVPNTDAVVPRAFGPLLMWTALPGGLMGLSLGRSRASAVGPGPR